MDGTIIDVVLENEVLKFIGDSGEEITFDLKDKNFGFLSKNDPKYPGLSGYKFRTSANTDKSRLIQMQLPGLLIIDDTRYKILDSKKPQLSLILSERVHTQPLSSFLGGYQRKSRKTRHRRHTRKQRKQRKTRRRI